MKKACIIKRTPDGKIDRVFNSIELNKSSVDRLVEKTSDVELDKSYKYSNGVSTLVYHKTGNNSIEIDLLDTLSEERGKGNAKNLLETFLNETDSLGITTTLLISPRDLDTTTEGLEKLYKSVGFVFQRVNDIASDFEMVRPAIPVSQKIREQFSAKKNNGLEQQLDEFGIDESERDANKGLLKRVFEGLKEAGLVVKDTIEDWVTIGRGGKRDSALQKSIIAKHLQDFSNKLGFNLGEIVDKNKNSLKKENELTVNSPVIDGFSILKKKYGETAAKSIRQHIPIALEYPNEFITFITNKIPIKEDVSTLVQSIGSRLEALFLLETDKSIKTTVVENKTPEELSKEAGYVFHRPKTKDDIFVFKQDFEEGEVLCTYNNVEGRIGGHFIFWIRRGDAESVIHADKITQDYLKEKSEGAELWRGYLESAGRKNNDGTFNLNNLRPSRQDPYGTSSMSVQIGRKNGSISIKNRYNHTVNNPDATFGNDLNNIIDGLHNSVYNIEGVPKQSNQELSLPENIVSDSKGSFMVFKKEFNNIYYSDNGYMKDNIIHIIDKSYQRLEYNMLIDSKNKKVINVEDERDIISDIIKIQIEKYKVNIQTLEGNIEFLYTNGFLDVVKGNITTIGNYFLNHNETLTSIDLPNVTSIGDYFLNYNKTLTSIDLPNVTSIGNSFLYYNETLTSIDLPNVTSIGNSFLYYNETLTSIDLPNVTSIGDYFLNYNETLTSIDLPNVTSIGDYLLNHNETLTSIDLPNVTSIGNYFLYHNETLTSIDLPNVTSIGNYFLNHNETLTSIDLPNVTSIGNSFLNYNKTLTSIDLPNVTSIWNSFLYYNETLTSIDLPNVTSIGNYFLYYNETLTSIDLPNVTSIGNSFLNYNETLTSIDLPNVTSIGDSFLYYNKTLTSIDLPNVTSIGDYFLYYNKTLTSIDLLAINKNNNSGKLNKEDKGIVQAQYYQLSGKNIIQSIEKFKESDNKSKSTVALMHEIMHPTVVSIIEGAKSGNKKGKQYTNTIVEEFNKKNKNNKITIDELVLDNDNFKKGETSDRYREVQEFIAESWEKYLYKGSSGFSEAFQKILDLITQAFRSIYSSIKEEDISPQLKQMFDDILGKEENNKVRKKSFYHSNMSGLQGEFRLRNTRGFYGIYFTPKKKYSKQYGDFTYKVDVYPNNTLILNDKDAFRYGGNIFNITKENYESLIKDGYDSIEWYRGGELLEFIALTNDIIGERGLQFQKEIIKEGSVQDKETTVLVSEFLKDKLGIDINVLNKENIAKELAKRGYSSLREMVQAWHGSAADFDRFTTEKMGTGEGAQAFGWGLYFTDLEGIAKRYAKDLSKITFDGKELSDVEFFDKLLSRLGSENDEFYNFDKGTITNLTKFKEYIVDSIEYFNREIPNINKDNKDVKYTLTQYTYKNLDKKSLEDDIYVYNYFKKEIENGNNGDMLVNSLPVFKAKADAARRMILEINKGASNEENILKSIIDYKTRAAKSTLNYYKYILNNFDKFNLSRNLYKVSLHKGKSPSEYTWLEWDSPLSEKQKSKLLSTPEVKQLISDRQKTRDDLSKKFADKGIKKEFKASFKGEDIYKGLSKILGSDKAASLFLLENGIDGIKYPAESLSAGRTSDNARGFNYVVFDENAITIDEKIQFSAGQAQSNPSYIRNIEEYGVGRDYDTDKVARERFDIPSLKQIGKGSDRTVFGLGDGKVLKVAHTARGLEQNMWEGEYVLSGLQTKVFEKGLNYVVTENVPRAKSSDVVTTYDIETGEENGTATFGQMMKDFDFFSQLAFDDNNPLLQDILRKYDMDVIRNYDVIWADFIAPRNWGYKDGVAYHIDGGTFGGVRMLDRYKGKTNLSDEDFREVYIASKTAKKQFGDKDRYTMFEGNNDVVYGFYDQNTNQIYLTEEYLNSGTLIHENWHLWKPILNQLANKDKQAKVLLDTMERLVNESGVFNEEALIERYNQGKTSQQSQIDFDMQAASQEANDITLNYNAAGEHLAPNGMPSNLSEEQAKIVRTEAFKNWFGDWENDPQNASKAVDGQGEPLVVYHGTADVINMFDERYGGDNTANNDYGAFYFSDDYDVAEDYGRQAIIRRYEGRNESELRDFHDNLTEEDIKNIIDDVHDFAENNLKVVSSFMNLRNPYVDGTQKGKQLDLQKGQRVIGFVKKGIDENYEFQNEEYNFNQDDINDYKEEIEKRAREDNGLDEDDEIQEWQLNDATQYVLEENGIYPEQEEHDGVIIKDVIDDIGDASNKIQTLYIAIDSNQIKLADGSNKTFSPYDNDIRYDAKQEESNNLNFQIIGQQGAKNLADAAYLLNNLSVAKEMQTKGETPLKIKLATGWELNNKKWVYEIDDNLTINNLEVGVETKPTLQFIDKEFVGGNLSEVIDYPTLFEAYPEFKNIQVAYYESANKEVDDVNMFITNQNKIYINANRIRTSGEEMDTERIKQSLLHEITHKVQEIEQFEMGFSQDKIGEVVEELRDFLRNKNAKRDELTELGKLVYDWSNKVSPAVDILRDDKLYGKEYIEYLVYKHLASEVQARAVEKKYGMGISNTKLISNFEDIAEKNKIYIQNKISPSALLSSEVYNPRPNETQQEYISRMKEEIEANLLGDNAKSYFEKIAKDNGLTAEQTKSFLQKLQDWITQFSQWLANQLGFNNITAEQARNLSTKDILDRVTTSMLRGDMRAEEAQQLSEIQSSLAQKESELSKKNKTLKSFQEELVKEQKQSGIFAETVQTGMFGVDVESVKNRIAGLKLEINKLESDIASLKNQKAVYEGKDNRQITMFNVGGQAVATKPIVDEVEVVNGFYSPLEKIISETKFDKLPAKQWVDKFAKGEEAKWTGLTDWLNSQQGSISKADIQNYLKDNRIEIVEVVKGGEQKVHFSIKAEKGKSVVYKNGVKDKEFDTYDKADDYVTNYKESEVDATKYSQYQLEGKKENYKEVLVTLPKKSFSDWLKENGKTFSEGNQKEYENKYGSIINNDRNFKSSHFDEPNILVHLRMSDRIDSEGNKVLHISEIQSDFNAFYRKSQEKVFDFINKNEDEVIELYKKSGKLVVEC